MTESQIETFTNLLNANKNKNDNETVIRLVDRMITSLRKIGTSKGLSDILMEELDLEEG